MRLALALSEEKALPGLSLPFLRRIVTETCRAARPAVFRAGRKVVLDVASVSEENISLLNRGYRRKNRPTDILSFGNFASSGALDRFQGETIDLGQIVLSPDFIRRSAEEDGVSWKREFTFVFSHGVLHLLGYDHSSEMFFLQDQVTDRLAPLSAKKKK